MKIGKLAQRIGVSADTVRFYERAGWLPRPERRANDYREYAEADVEHLRLLIDLRRLEIPLADAARIAAWCHSGHCGHTTAELPALLARQRSDIAERIAGLRALDAKLDGLQRHLARARPALNVLTGGARCCDVAHAVIGNADGGCACCRSLPHQSRVLDRSREVVEYVDGPWASRPRSGPLFPRRSRVRTADTSVSSNSLSSVTTRTKESRDGGLEAEPGRLVPHRRHRR